jgi:muramoyltetrapeptide carboxypeptidase
MKQPPFLSKGATIGITCPAGYMDAAKVETCIATLQSWGYEVMLGKTVGSLSTTYFSGTDEERRDEIQAMLDDSSIDAILCGRGGYGMVRIIDQLDFKRFKKNPKWVIGFSDITVLHNRLHALKVASLHAPMAGAFNNGGADGPFVASLHAALKGKKAAYHSVSAPEQRNGEAAGLLVGGNLTMLANSIGTPTDIKTKGKILFIEDIGEQLYAVDRLMHQLDRAGKLADLAGLIVGGFTDLKDTDRPFGKSIETIICDIVKPYAYPVAFHFPVSHASENVAMKIGALHRLTVKKSGVRLKEL